MKWTSVNDSLPDKNERILVTDGESVCMHYKQSAWNFAGSPGEDLYCAPGMTSCGKPQWDDLDCKINDNVTHWMYMPKLDGKVPGKRVKKRFISLNDLE